MPNYQNGKIYKIESLIGNCIYYGSTTKKYLSNRLSGHIYDYKKNKDITSGEVLQYPDANIILVESYPCNDKNELTARECYYIKNNDCVNKKIPGRTDKQYRIDNKGKMQQYRIDNKEKIQHQTKQYYEDNKEKIQQCRKQYNIDNKEKIQQREKQYRIDNKEKIKQRYSKQYICVCGSIYTHCHYKRHNKSKKHINYMNNPFIGSHLIF